jgi:GNAT superfamily N-acetyltransferase
MNIQIRKGETRDLEGVHRLIRELAEFERAPQEVETTANQFEKDRAGNCPLFDFFVAEETDTRIIVGAAVFFFAYSTWKGKMLYLDDLVITESYRRKGIGRLLFDRLVRHALENDARQFRWHVLYWNETAIEFYKKLNADLDPEWVTGKLTYEQIRNYDFSS